MTDAKTLTIRALRFHASMGFHEVGAKPYSPTVMASLQELGL